MISKFKANKIKIFCFMIVLVGLSIVGWDKANAQWDVPSNLPPDSNIYAPLNVGPYKQAKEGGLLLDPLYNPFSAPPDFEYPLEVRGTKNAYINNFNILPGGDLSVDTDTLFVDGELHKVGIGTTSFESTSTLEVHDGGVYIGKDGNGVAGHGLEINSNSSQDIVLATTTGDGTSTIYGQGIGNTVGVYGLNASNGVGIYARSNDASALVGSVSSIYNTSGTIISGIYGTARGLGSWAGYFEQRMFGNDEMVANKFLPNKLQNSEIPYTVGWEVGDVVDSELINLEHMTFDGRYIWATGGYWDGYNPEFVMVIDPDNMEIVNKIVFSGVHAIGDIIYGGGYIWLAHIHDYSGGNIKSQITRINPNDYSYITYPTIYPGALGSSNNSYAVKLLYDDQTTDGPYIWVLNKLKYGERHSISQLYINGIVKRTFSIDANANGGNKCSRLVVRDSLNQCSDYLDNDNNGSIDNGLCTYVAANQAACTGNWEEGCSDRTFANETDCTNGGAIWATTCSNPSCTNLNTCELCTGTGIWNGTSCDGDANCNTEATCEGTVTCGGNWTGGDNRCVAGAPLGFCSNGINNTWGECINASAIWTWYNSSNDERIATAYLGGPSGLTLDGDGNIWVTFFGTPNFNDNNYYAGEGYAKFKASDPEKASDQYVYCSGPETGPSDIAYDSANDIMWIPYAPANSNDNRGVAKINASNGQVSEFLWHMFGTAGDPEHTVRYFGANPGGPSIWLSNLGVLHKINPNDNSIVNNYYHSVSEMDMLDYDFDSRDPDNPVIWQVTGNDGVILKHTMDNPPGYSTTANLIKGATVDTMVTDGNYIWANSSGSTIVTKYNAKDRSKVAEYDLGVNTDLMVYDGRGVWVPFYSGQTRYKRIDATTGVVDEYAVVPNVGNTYYSTDITFDGTNIWQTIQDQNRVVRVSLSSCSPTTLQCTVANSYNVQSGPRNILYDGKYLWISHGDNRISKFTTAGVTEAVLSIPEISGDRIRTMEYDGTYIWFGTYDVDADGNSVFKLNPRGIDNIGADATNEEGVCSNNNSINCSTSTICGAGNTCNAVIEGKYPIFHKINDGVADVKAMAFDGTFMWVAHRAYNQNSETHGDGICNDNKDNDGNGLCDYDGAAGYPGCSGRPDPGCTSANDTYENYNNEIYITRINAATGEIVESIPVTSAVDSYEINDMLFDGQHIWIGGTDFDHNTLAQYYSGTGFNDTDLINNLLLRTNIPLQSDYMQSGSISIYGSAVLGDKLIVTGDLVVQNNTWGGGADNLVDFGTGCADGEFVKGISIGGVGSDQIQCRSL